MAACFLVLELDANQSVVMATPPSHSYQYREKVGRNYEGSDCHSLWEGVPGDLAKQQPMKSRTKKKQEPSLTGRTGKALSYHRANSGWVIFGSLHSPWIPAELPWPSNTQAVQRREKTSTVMRRKEDQLSNQPVHAYEVPSTSKALHAANIYYLVWST